MKDIRMYGDKELSLHVFNDPYFYNELWNPDYVFALVKEEFHYTYEQLEQLCIDVRAHMKELDHQRALARGEAQ